MSTKRKINPEAIEEDETPRIDPIQEAKLALQEEIASSLGTPEILIIEAIETKINDLINVVDEQAIHQIREEISVYYPEQLFSPIPYMSYRCGNLWYKTVVLPGETREEAYSRAWKYLRSMVESQFQICREEFWERHRSMSI